MVIKEIRMTGKYVDDLVGTDNIRVIRYAEVWLNKAEALARRNQGGDRAEAQTNDQYLVCCTWLKPCLC